MNGITINRNRPSKGSNTKDKVLQANGTFLHSTSIRLNKEISKRGVPTLYVTNNIGQRMVSATIQTTARQRLFDLKTWVNRYWKGTTRECTIQVIELVSVPSTKGHYEKPLVRYTKVLDVEELSTPITDAEVLEEYELDKQYQAHIDEQDYLFDDQTF